MKHLHYHDVDKIKQHVTDALFEAVTLEFS